MKKLIFAVAALSFASSSALAQDGDILRIGTEGNYPPYNFINDNNELEGFEIDLGNEICERGGFECEWIINDWDTIIPNLVAGNYDIIMAGMSVTEARQEVISFTDHYKEPDPSFYLALAGTDPSVTEDGVITAQSNTMQAGYAAETDVDLIEFPTPDETIAAVRSGEADAVLADGDFLVPIMEESGGELEFIGEPVLIGGGVAVGVRQSDEELRETLGAIIGEMKEDGSLNELLIEWYGEEVPQF